MRRSIPAVDHRERNARGDAGGCRLGCRQAPRGGPRPPGRGARMQQPPSGNRPTGNVEQSEVACCFAGCGPAGATLGLLLARAGVEVLVLVLGVSTDAGDFTLADFRRLPGRHRYVAFMPQWDFLDFVVGQARRLPTFRLRLRAEALGVLEEAGRVVGLTCRDQDGTVRQVHARLTVAADGRDSRLRRSAGLRPRVFGAPMDVLWFRLSRRPDDRLPTFGRLAAGHLMVLIDRGAYWQVAYVIHKGAVEELHRVGLARFRATVAELVPFLVDRVEELRGWDDVRVLRVQVDRLRRWFRPGFVCIGDAAHAMSPIGGVGIHL